MLREENEQTPTASQAGKSSMSDSGTPSEDTEGQTPEEVEFNSLKGSTQDRIKALVREKRRVLEENERLKTNSSSTPTPGIVPPAPGITPEIKEAVSRLHDVGIATQEDIDAKIQRALGFKNYDDELKRLESSLNGEDGRPKFTREEYEDYVNRHQEYRNYLPEDVYEKMYREELSDWRINHKESTTRSKTPSMKPVRTSGREEALTPEYIEQRLKAPDGPAWYDENKDRINAALTAQSSS